MWHNTLPISEELGEETEQEGLTIESDYGNIILTPQSMNSIQYI